MNRIIVGLISMMFFLTALAQEAEAPSKTVESKNETKPTLALCFAPGTSDEVVQQAYESAGEENLSFYRLGTRWSSTTLSGGGLGQGDPTIITWSIVPDGTIIPGSAGEPSNPSNLVAWLNTIYPGGPEEWMPLFDAIFANWSTFGGLTYVHEENDDGAAFPSSPGQAGVRGDVRVSAHLIDGNSNILAYNFFPNTGDMVIDSADNFFNNTAQNSLGMRNVLSHEHGHGMGFSHVCPVEQTKLMEPFVSFAFDGPQHDDLLAVNRGYGDPNEHNDTPNDATFIGDLNESGFIYDGTLSIDDPADQDYYRFTLSSQFLVTLNTAPIGFEYLEGPQVGSVCTAGTLFNSEDNIDLAIEILDSDGSTVLASADNTGPAGSETITEEELTAGTYYIRVSSAAGTDVQLYEFDMSLEEVAIPCFYIDLITAWNNPDGVSCLGANLTIQDIIQAVIDGQVSWPTP